ncbi:hypothetical protein J4E81_010100 [Alternaria sp. BMP 2799]|nr:hypothetical protein J4E81_010100 [Alternaria sp. BMP 2799]
MREDSVADAGADEDGERADDGEVATPIPPPGARRQDFSSIMRAEFNPEMTTPFGDDGRQQHTTPPRAKMEGAQLRVWNEPAAELKGEREKYGLQPGETMEQRYDELALRFKSLKAEHEGEDGKGGLLCKYDVLEKNLNELKEMHDGEDGKEGLVSELEQLKQHHGNSADRSEHLEESDRGKGGLVEGCCEKGECGDNATRRRDPATAWAHREDRLVVVLMKASFTARANVEFLILTSATTYTIGVRLE